MRAALVRNKLEVKRGAVEAQGQAQGQVAVAGGSGGSGIEAAVARAEAEAAAAGGDEAGDAKPKDARTLVREAVAAGRMRQGDLDERALEFLVKAEPGVAKACTPPAPCPHHARTVPAPCPHHARTVPAPCPHHARTVPAPWPAPECPSAAPAGLHCPPSPYTALHARRAGTTLAQHLLGTSLAPPWQLAIEEFCELSQGDGLSNITNKSSFFMGLLRERISGAPAGRSWGGGREVGREVGRGVARG